MIIVINFLRDMKLSKLLKVLKHPRIILYFILLASLYLLYHLLKCYFNQTTQTFKFHIAKNGSTGTYSWVNSKLKILNTAIMKYYKINTILINKDVLQSIFNNSCPACLFALKI